LITGVAFSCDIAMTVRNRTFDDTAIKQLPDVAAA
jgi:hypothetical protein